MSHQAEEVVAVDEYRELVVEKLGAHPAVDGIMGPGLVEQGLHGGDVMSRGVDLPPIPQLGPGTQLEAVRPQRALFHRFQRAVVGLQIGVIHIGVKPKVEHPVGPVHHVELASGRVGSSHIGRFGEENHPSKMFIKACVADGGDLVPLAFVIARQANRAEIVPVFVPTGLQILCVDGLQLGIACDVDLDVVVVEGAELYRRGMVDFHGVTELEVVHRRCAVGEVQRRRDVEVGRVEVVVWRLRIDDARAKMVQVDTGLHREIPETMPHHEIASQVLGMVLIPIAHDGIPHVGVVCQGVHDVLFRTTVPAAADAQADLPVLGVGQVVIDICREGHA